MENIKLNNPDPLKIPEAMMIRPKLVAVFDNIKDTINIMSSVYPSNVINLGFWLYRESHEFQQYALEVTKYAPKPG